MAANRKEITSSDSGFSEIFEQKDTNMEDGIPKARRANSEEPTTMQHKQPNRLSFHTNKHIFEYLETHGMDPKKPPNWWIAEEETEEVQKIFSRTLSVPSMITYADTETTRPTDNNAIDNSNYRADSESTEEALNELK